ncbi:hypothetical protein AAEO57_08970 [Flavobacterium sp. DGU38]|uniref:Uncharacterized protein n=1 Tax=Flavobacterium calami TaxID=3139144 RepID=A0ABU9IN91_9FLAO
MKEIKQFKLFLILIAFNYASAQNTLTKNLNQENMIKHPSYIAELVSSRCSIELLINDILSFNNYENGTMSVDWPLNLLILEDGIQNFELRILPIKGATSISEKAFAKIKIVVREAIDEYVPQEEINPEIEINFTDKKNLPLYIHKGQFKSKTPYQFDGWKNSIDLSQENQEKLFEEIIQWNTKLKDIYANFKLEEYLKIFKSKNNEIYKTLYLNHLEIEQQNNSAFHPKFKDLVALPDNLYKLKLYANGKLVSVTLPYKLPGFTYDPKVKDENAMGFSLNVYFHRKEKGSPLEIIR